jgi:transcriptional regulator with XRE-family HTH domain
MSDYSKAAGKMIRQLRQQRGLTLARASAIMRTSAPVLSRKERGQDNIERTDIRRTIEAFQLTPWEAYELWLAAGFIPEPTLETPSTYDLRELAEALLPHLPCPAFIIDELWHVWAWNQGIEEIWQVSQADSEYLHVLDDLFSERVRGLLGEEWDRYISQAMRVFYNKTIRISNDPAFQQVLTNLVERHGDAFKEKWNTMPWGKYVDKSLPPVDMGGTMVTHNSPFGPIEYIVMQALFHFPQSYELVMYVPFGIANQSRYQQFRASMVSPNQLYFREMPDGTQQRSLGS